MREKVYAFLKTIPKGKVATYGQIASCLGNKYYARAVGNLLHRNPDPTESPCHRVVNREGALSAQYAFGGAAAQRTKLEQEGIVFLPDGCQNGDCPPENRCSPVGTVGAFPGV